MVSPSPIIEAVALTRRAVAGAGPDKPRTTRPARRR
jgi:hypothetical protein